MGLPALESNGRSHDTEALYREHGPAVARLCASLLRDRAEAEDATQQVFLAAHRALLNGSTPREPLAWLLAVARHECYARFRQRSVSPVPTGDIPDSPTPDASVQVVREGELAAVWDEIRQMPPAQRDAFLLREIRGLSYGQLAAELSLSPPSVRSLLLRARRRLRDRLRGVAAGFGGAPWIQPLVRLVTGGEGASPLPSATKAAAVGIGALALVGGGSPAQGPHHAPRLSGHEAARHHARAQVGRGAASTPFAAATATRSEHRGGHNVRHSEPEHSRLSGSGSSDSGSDSGEVRGDLGTPSGDGSSGSGRDGSGDATAVAQPTSDGGHGSGSASSGPGPDGPGDRSLDGGSSGSSSGPGDGSTTTTTTTTSSGSDGSGSGSGHDGGSSGGGSDGG